MDESVLRAEQFAADAHGAVGQLRKYSHEPYIYHPLGVVRILLTVTSDPVILSAAWMHDVIENTCATEDDVRTEFGDDIAYLVAGLSDVSVPEDGPRHVRKPLIASCWLSETGGFLRSKRRMLFTTPLTLPK